MQKFASKYLFDGTSILENKTVVIENGIISAIIPTASHLDKSEILQLEDKYFTNGILTAGFIDLQLNGCGGVAFNTDISKATLETIYQTCRQFGTTSFLPTLITCDFADVITALNVIKDWMNKYDNKRGVLGIHLEGPFISKYKHGIHPLEHIIKPTDELLAQIVNYNKYFPIKMTIAVEEFSQAQIKFLVDNGIILAVGHSNASYETVIKSIRLGVRAATHTFNAMSGLTARDPGVIGATLSSDIYAGLIADLIHVDSANIKLLNTIKSDKIYLVTDSVTPTGTNMTQFDFAKTTLYIKDNKCVNKNGVLGGAYLTMNQAILNCVNHCDISLASALNMASKTPAEVVGVGKTIGTIAPGYRADLVYMDMKTFHCEIVN